MVTRHAGFIRALNTLICARDLQEMNIKCHVSQITCPHSSFFTELPLSQYYDPQIELTYYDRHFGIPYLRGVT